MKGFYLILEDCLINLSNGTSTVDDCLMCYPEHAAKLRPLLEAAFFVDRVRNVTPSPSFIAYTRSEMVQHMRFNPKQIKRIMLHWRLTAVLSALIVAFFIAGTARAQSALPGDAYYGWKRSSELAWLALTPDPVAADIVLADRRLDEWIAVANDPLLGAGAKNDYQKALSKLASTDKEKSLALIEPMLQLHHRLLNKAGLSMPELDDYLSEIEALDSVTVPTLIAPVDVPTEIATEAVTDHGGGNDNANDNANENNNGIGNDNNGNGSNDNNGKDNNGRNDNNGKDNEGRKDNNGKDNEGKSNSGGKK